MTLLLGLAVALIVGAVAMYFAPKGFRTYVTNIAQAGLLALTGIASELQAFDWAQLLDQKAAAGAMLGIIVLNIILRSVTTTPPGQGE